MGLMLSFSFPSATAEESRPTPLPPQTPGDPVDAMPSTCPPVLLPVTCCCLL